MKIIFETCLKFTISCILISTGCLLSIATILRSRVGQNETYRRAAVIVCGAHRYISLCQRDCYRPTKIVSCAPGLCFDAVQFWCASAMVLRLCLRLYISANTYVIYQPTWDKLRIICLTFGKQWVLVWLFRIQQTREIFRRERNRANLQDYVLK